jgi:hypothetical protein
MGWRWADCGISVLAYCCIEQVLIEVVLMLSRATQRSQVTQYVVVSNRYKYRVCEVLCLSCTPHLNFFSPKALYHQRHGVLQKKIPKMLCGSPKTYQYIMHIFFCPRGLPKQRYQRTMCASGVFFETRKQYCMMNMIRLVSSFQITEQVIHALSWFSYVDFIYDWVLFL